VAPRAFGTVPAGSFVREKSRFALYSASGTPARRVVFVVVVEVRRAAAAPARFGGRLLEAPRFDAPRLEARGFETLERSVAEERLGPDLAALPARERFVRGVFRVVAMPGHSCQEHASRGARRMQSTTVETVRTDAGARGSEASRPPLPSFAAPSWGRRPLA
jgi:hypothetical protein